MQRPRSDDCHRFHRLGLGLQPRARFDSDPDYVYPRHGSPPELRRRGAEPPSGGSCVSLTLPMRTSVYIDGFNLYYGCLKGTPYRWLDPRILCATMLPRDEIHRIRYYTARVKPGPRDPMQRQRQDVYLRALKTVPGLSLHFGHFLSHDVMMPSATPPHGLVRVIRTEEKGSDVNLASHLLRDAYQDDFDVAVIVSNDSDLLEPIRIVKRELQRTVGILNPHARPSRVLLQHADFLKTIRGSALRRSQFPSKFRDRHGTVTKPKSW